MGGVRPVAQGVQDQHVQPLQQRPARVRNGVGVGAIGDIPEPKPQHIEVRAMFEANGHQPPPQQLKGRRSDAMKFQLRNRSGMRRFAIHERIVERLANPLFNNLFAVQRHRLSEIELQDADVVQPKQMVRVLMRVDDGVDYADLLPQQLQTQIGRSIDQQIPLGKPENGRAPRALIARMFAAADRAAAANGGNTHRGTGPEQDELAADVGGQRLDGQGQIPFGEGNGAVVSRVNDRATPILAIDCPIRKSGQIASDVPYRPAERDR